MIYNSTVSYAMQYSAIPNDSYHNFKTCALII